MTHAVSKMLSVPGSLRVGSISALGGFQLRFGSLPASLPFYFTFKKPFF